MSSFFTRFKRLAGIDIRSDKYTYAKDPTFGYTAASRIPERWVKTTCGYCSVGCGMLVGVKEGRAVAVRTGNFIIDEPEVLTALATIVIAVFTWRLWWSTDKLWKEAKTASEIASKSASNLLSWLSHNLVPLPPREGVRG